MKVRYMTIEREYGSGGTQIAKRMESITGIPCYGREIIESASKSLDVSCEDIERYEETVTGSFMYTMYLMSQSHSANADMLTKEAEVFVTEQEEIQRLAKQGRAIFLGHCASEALKDEEGVVKVFIHCSDNKIKQERIVKNYGIEKSQAERVSERFDRKRANYYQANTHNKWKDYGHYDIVIDSAVIGVEGCVAMLSGLFLTEDV
jgi:cytidylate kinase